jgi:tetratricopeptide (TPR) repeat protein
MTGTAIPPEPAGLLSAAQARYADDRWDEAEALCREILLQDPRHADALGLLAAILADGPGAADTLEVLLRHLALRPDDGVSLHRLGRLRAAQGDSEIAVKLLQRAAESRPELAIIQNDLAILLDRLGRRAEAMAAVDRAVGLDPTFALAHGNRGFMLLDMRRFDEAVEAQLQALAHLTPAQSAARGAVLHTLVRAAAAAGRLAEAEAAIRAEMAAGRGEVTVLEHLATLLDQSHRPREALAVRNDMARRAGVLQDGLEDGAETTVLILAGAGGGMAPTRYLVDPEAFAILGVTLLTADQPDAPLGQVDIDTLRRADVVFSTLADVDHDDGQLDAASAVCADIGKPVVNPPDAIRRTGRHTAASLFADIADMVTPAARYIDRDGLAALPIAAPILVRPVGDHGGDNLKLLRDEADRSAFLAGNPAERLMISPFHHFQSPDGHWRKYRLIFVDRRVYPYHLAIGEDWLLHYWRAEMNKAPWKKAEEARFLDDWRGVFGERAAAAVEEAARRLDLDYGGMDCALTADGRVLLFEANACILLHLDESAADFPYKHRHVPLIREAFSQLVRRRARP